MTIFLFRIHNPDEYDEVMNLGGLSLQEGMQGP